MTSKDRKTLKELINMIFVGTGLVIWYLFFRSDAWYLLFVFILAGVLLSEIVQLFIPALNVKHKRKKNRTQNVKENNKRTNKLNNSSNLTSDIDQLSGQEFEELMYAYFKDHGYNPQLTDKTGDHGVDLVIKDPQDGLQIAVQCKCYKKGNNIGNKPLRDLEGAKRYYKCPATLFITTSDFTSKAREFADSLNSMDIWNGFIVREKLEKWQNKH
ncbi:restriction endonuclease [Lentibacillus cibarius]|uniref:Restriction endonuclease n=1 Tax=Lentibacillus cibarius TaxID=2583219 RepID=A0A5S3QKZ6_9BACI|nr:restriction endonuclease [Lentibacillus cibarius]TMN21891.1 restriction endonuclease [Lentibacillus cibarius]